MATGQNHYAMHCLTFHVDQEQAKIRKLKYEGNTKKNTTKYENRTND